MTSAKHIDTDFIKAIGMLLIINSHMDAFYPFARLATGGAIGNAIFFFFSAYGLYFSQQRNGLPFGEWMKGRVARIYPSIWIALILLKLPLLLGFGEFQADSITPFIGEFFNPPHWFIRSLLVFYFLSFFFLNSDHYRKIPLAIGFTALVYAAIYLTWVDLSKWSIEFPPFYLLHYLMIFLLGIYIAAVKKPIRFMGTRDLVVGVMLLGIIYGHKYLMAKGLYPEHQFVQQAALYPLLLYMLKISRSPFIMSVLTKSKAISSGVTFISSHSLELYIVHETILDPVRRFNLPFPLNVVVFLSLTFILAAIVNRLAEMVRSYRGNFAITSPKLQSGTPSTNTDLNVISKS